MKRGLVVLDRREVGDEWAQRVRTLQKGLVDAGVDVALVYGDVFRSDDIGYLTNLCIYWNEGILAVPKEGRPTFLTKLSPRVHTWMRATSTVEDLRSGPSFGKLIEAYLHERRAAVLGLVDAGLWPGLLSSDVASVAVGWEIRDLGPLVRARRAIPSPAELDVLRLGGALVAAALENGTAVSGSPTEQLAAIERSARCDGCTDAEVDVALAPGGTRALRITVQYSNGWLHAERLVDDDSAGWVNRVKAAHGAVLAAVAPGVDVAALYAAAAVHLTSLPQGAIWRLTAVDQADLSTFGEMNSPPAFAAGGVVAVGIELEFGATRVGVADTAVVGPDGTTVLTCPLA
jgi:Xaa-Pro aminopeptidase